MTKSRSFYIQAISDSHKDIHGFRPAGYWWDQYFNLNLKGLKSAAKEFSDQVKDLRAEEEAQSRYEEECEIGHLVYSLLQEST
jgi:hypothetical protein|tara:strand:- start:252 stop:500 length:249 start_codon:yes stop_codon:yes gene_type:complete